MSDALEVLREVTSSAASLRELHPLKLDRWHRALVGLPGHIYMQYGCVPLFEHVDLAAKAIKGMVDLLGADSLPLAPQELAQRHIREFRWYVPSEARDGPVPFQALWDKASSAWKLTCLTLPDTTKSVAGLEDALAKSLEWAGSLKPEPEKE